VEAVLERGGRCIWCYHVNRPDPDPAWGDAVQVFSLNDMKDHLGECEVVLCAAEASRHLLHQGHAPFFDQERTVIIADLGVPRNVSPELASVLSGADVLNLDHLKRWASREYGHLRRALDMSREIIRKHKDSYDALLRSFQGRNAAQ
jgi:glutamyl-tRNA reductase